MRVAPDYSTTQPELPALDFLVLRRISRGTKIDSALLGRKTAVVFDRNSAVENLLGSTKVPESVMDIILGLTLFVAAIVILFLAVKLYVLFDSVAVLKSQVQQRAADQFQDWKQSECEAIKLQQKEIATREATVELQTWKATCELSIRTDAVQRSKSVIVGKVTEHIVPYLPEFRYNPKDARFIGSPIDFLVFDGLDQEALVHIVFVEVKTGSSALSKRERQVRDAIRDGRIRWEELRVARNETPETLALLPA